MESPLHPARSLALLITLSALGCASPGVPRPPTLNLPQPVNDLTATRIGDTVQLHFTLPSHTTDKLPIRGATLSATFCRELDHRPCQPLATSTIPLTDTTFTCTDTLPPTLTQGDPHTLRYRVTLSNTSNHSAEASTPAFTATGPAPTPIQGLQATGSRLGIVLHWTPASTTGDTILLQREDRTAAKSTTIDLIAPPDTPTNTLLDTTAHPDTPYRYTAMRSLTIQLGGRAIELRSTPSPTAAISLRQTYPPLTPTGLTAAPFTAPDATFAVDLVWQPVDEPSPITPLAGYNLYREATRLNPTPLQLPAFHDTTAAPNTPYRYSVTAIDTKGNESPAASVALQP